MQANFQIKSQKYEICDLFHEKKYNLLMPTAFDQIFVPLATQLVDNTFGFDATFRRVSRTYDPATGKNTGSNTDTTVKITPPAPYSQRRIDGTVIQLGDQQIMISSESGVVPQSADLFVIGGAVWQVVAVFPIVSGEQTAAYNIQLRQ
jgi:hypothetical protein